MSEIQTVDVVAIDHPLKEPFEISLGTRTEAKNVLVTVHTAQGVTGRGEASPMPPVTGETQEAAVATARSAATLLIGEDCSSYRAISRRIRESYPGMASAQFAVEAAVFDARCRELKCELSELFGGPASPVQTDMTIPITTPEEARRRATNAVEGGYQRLKIKTGSGVDADLERVKAVNDATPEAALKIDANQAWTVKETMMFLDRLRAAGIDLELLEQPIPKDDIEGMAAVTERSRVPIAADETVFTPADAMRVVRANAADIINVKLGKSGILGAADIVSIADAANLELMIGCMLEGSVGIHTAAHLVVGTGAFSYVDLDGSRLLADDFVPACTGPEIDIDGPGHGVTVENQDL